MIVIVAVDDNNGMMFNHRRQSQDAILRERISELTKDSVLWVNEYTSKQFSVLPSQVRVSENFLDEASQGEYCFVEDQGIKGYAPKIEKLILFYWNRKYPSDMKLDLLPQENGMVLEETWEFVGKSHEKITGEIWSR